MESEQSMGMASEQSMGEESMAAPAMQPHMTGGGHPGLLDHAPPGPDPYDLEAWPETCWPAGLSTYQPAPKSVRPWPLVSPAFSSPA
jgi:hypothetical protein